MRLILAATLAIVSTHALAYSVTRGSSAIGDHPSKFWPTDLGRSTLTEKFRTSTASAKSDSSTFDLGNMSSKLREKTERALTELGARRDGTAIIVDLPSDVLFDFDKSNIRDDARVSLERLASVLKAVPDRPVKVIGHTDAKGSDDYNLRLSQRRAMSVVSWLVQNGVTSSLLPEGMGESSPVAPNEKPDGSDDPDGRQKNRRVQFVIGGNT